MCEDVNVWLCNMLAERLHLFVEHSIQLNEASMHGRWQYVTPYHELDESDKECVRAEVNAIVNTVVTMQKKGFEPRCTDLTPNNFDKRERDYHRVVKIDANREEDDE